VRVDFRAEQTAGRYTLWASNVECKAACVLEVIDDVRINF